MKGNTVSHGMRLMECLQSLRRTEKRDSWTISTRMGATVVCIQKTILDSCETYDWNLASLRVS